MLKKSFLVCIVGSGLATLTNIACADSPSISRKVDSATADILVAEAYFGHGSQKYISYFDGPYLYGDPLFLSYDGLAKYDGSFGFFDVNPWTGDVWALWGCKKISTPASLKLQAKIKQKFTPEELAHYDELSDMKPFCVVDDSEK